LKSQKSKFLITKLVVLFLIYTIISSSVLVNGADYTVNSYQGETPIIDGVIDATEEQGTGKPTKITLTHDPWDYVGRPREIDVKIGSSHSNDSYLYINAIVNYRKIISGNITFHMRKNESENYFDLKRISSNTNSSMDGYKEDDDQYFWNFTKDQDNGGTEDTEGACVITQKNIMFELRMPFNSGDTLGYDVNIEVGNEIEFRISFTLLYEKSDEAFGVMYASYLPKNCKLIIQNTTAVPLSTIGIILGIGLIISTYFLRKRKDSKD